MFVYLSSTHSSTPSSNYPPTHSFTPPTQVQMFRRASLKLGLDRAVLADANAKSSSSDASKPLTAKEVDTLLKKGAYSVFSEKDDSVSKQFCEDDIDNILKSSSYTVKGEKKKETSQDSPPRS